MFPKKRGKVQNFDPHFDHKYRIGQKQRTSGTMVQDIRIHDMTRHNQLKGSYKVYC